MRIALCGSMVFTEKMLEAKRRLEASGHEVFVSGFIEEYIGKNEKENEKSEILLVTGPKWQGYYTIVGEPIAEAVKRELQEEIGTAPRRLEFLTVNEAINPAWYHRPAHFIFINYVGWIHQKEVTICTREFTEHLWIKPKRALREVQLAPSVPKVIEAYRERYIEKT